jgi:hypothetical protein
MILHSFVYHMCNIRSWHTYEMHLVLFGKTGVTWIKGKRTMRDSCIHPPPNPKEKGLKTATRKSPRAPEITKRGKRERHNQAFRNHAESSCIPWRFIQGLACLLIIHPSLKISPWSSQASPRNSKGKEEDVGVLDRQPTKGSTRSRWMWPCRDR